MAVCKVTEICKQTVVCLLKQFVFIVYVLLGISLASNCSWPMFQNPVSVPSSKAGCRATLHTLHPAFEDGTDTGFRIIGQLQFDAGEIPKRTYKAKQSRYRPGVAQRVPGS